MRIVVIGGTGLIGRKLVELLQERGHDAVAASPSTGVDTVTGQGLLEALQGADVVVDVANAPSFEDGPVMEFFRTATANVVAAEKEAGVGHHVALSIVGADRMTDIGYMRAEGGAGADRARERRAVHDRARDAVLRVRRSR
ncbi:SDR family oxidoreductase [Leifsonia sp. L25]|uniref:SDR family oxidoreductase n=1 Tax=Leifsonia sp. L25 TaxID=3423957 RepID=UPI003D68CF75